MYHFIGIKQPNQCALSLLLDSLGYKVDGSDNKDYTLTTDLLKEKGIKVLPISEDNINEDMIVVQGENISDDNIEIERANELGVKVYSYAQMAKRLTEMFPTIAVSGCTAKNETSEMMTYVLSSIIGCNYMLGDGKGYADRENKYLCLEASENNRMFLDYNSYYAVITNIDINYTDCYKNIDELILAYQEFANKAEKMVLVCGDDRYTHLLNNNAPIFYYGLNDDNDVIAKEVNYSTSGTSFEVHVEDNYYGNFELPIYGKQMLLNVLSVIGICYYERIDVKYVSKALKEFFINKNVLNDKQFKDIVTVNCNINHPKEAKATIKALKQKYPDKKLKTIFNPTDLFENEQFINGYIDSINLSDESYLVDDDPDNIVLPNIKESLSKVDKKSYVDLNNLGKIINNKNTVLMFINNQDLNCIQNKVEELISNKNKKS